MNQRDGVRICFAHGQFQGGQVIIGYPEFGHDHGDQEDHHGHHYLHDTEEQGAEGDQHLFVQHGPPLAPVQAAACVTFVRFLTGFR